MAYPETRLIIQQIRYKDWDKVKDIIRRFNINLNAIHKHSFNSQRFETLVSMLVFTKAITLEDFETTLDLFISLGFGTDLPTPLYYYFTEAISMGDCQMIALLIKKAGDRFNEYIGPHRYFFVSIFWYVLNTGNPQTIKMFVDTGIDVNQPIQDKYYLVYPIHILISSSRLVALRYLIETGANFDIPAFQSQQMPVPLYSLSPTKSTRDLIAASHHDDMIELYHNAFINIENRELNLERRVFLRLIIDEIQLDDVAKYIQSANYTWLANTHSEAPLVLQAKAKIKQYAAERKRQREI